MLLGIFDSGIGGLTVLDAIWEEQPDLSTIYLADQAHFPYGTMSSETLTRHAICNTAFLVAQGASAILIACHTASAYTLKPLQEVFPIPIFGMIEPTLKLALSTTRNGRIAILGTEATIRSGAYGPLIPLALQEFIDAIEKEKITESILINACEKIKSTNADTVILGCTHFALFEKELQSRLIGAIQVINPARAVAKELGKKLSPLRGAPLKRDFYTTGNIEALASRLPKGKFNVQFFPQNG